VGNSINQVIAAVSMIGVAVILFFAVRAYLSVASERRMRSMLERVGVDPAIVTSGDSLQIMSDIRQRCHTCSTEDVCERWLAGEERGSNDFCPNASVFAMLRETPAPR